MSTTTTLLLVSALITLALFHIGPDILKALVDLPFAAKVTINFIPLVQFSLD